MASRAREKKNKSPCSSRCGLAALPQRGGCIAIAYIEGIVVYSSAARDYILAAVPGPRVRPGRHATQRARSEIFKLSLSTIDRDYYAGTSLAPGKAASSSSSSRLSGSPTFTGKFVTFSELFGLASRPMVLILPDRGRIMTLIRVTRNQLSGIKK